MTKEFPVLIPLEKGRTYHSDAQVGLDFDEDSHPRAPKGGPKGGEFVKKDQAPEGVLPDDYFRQSYELKQKHEVEKFPVQYRRHGHPTPETRLVTVPPNADPERKTPAPVGGEIIEARGRKEADRINAALYNAYGYHAKIVHQHGGYILKDTGLDAETAHDLMFLLGSSIASKKVTQELIEGARAQRVAQAAENARRYDEMLAAREANAGRFVYKKDTMTKAFPVLKTTPLPEDMSHDSQGGPPPAKPFLIPHAKRPRCRVPNRQGGGGEVLNEEETDRTNLVLDPPVLIPFEKALPGKAKDGHKTPPKGYPEKRQQYGDPENYKYPLDTEEHVRAAWSYLAMPRNAAKYSPEQVNAIKARIKRAGKPHGIAFEGAPLDKDLGLGP